MTPRRHETKLPSNQPVRFYKIVALSFLVLTIALFAVIIFMSSKRANITITTKPSAVEINRTLEIGESAAPNSIPGTVTSTYINISRSFSPSGEKQEAGIAKGMVTLHNEGSSDQVLIATTRLLTPDDVLFRLDEQVVVPAGGTVEAAVHADQEGASGDVGPVDRFTIPGLNATLQKIVYGTSNEAMTGGVSTVGVLSEDDLRKAEKVVLENVEQEVANQVEQMYPDKNYLFKVTDESDIKHDRSVGEEVGEFNTSLSALVVIAAYEESDLVAWAEDMLMKRAIDESENIEPSGELPTLEIENYEDDKVTVNVIYTGIATINPEGKQLSKEMFYGKTKEEVRKYLLSLDHVHTVDISFRPAWMRTVPHVADHVSIIIQNIE